MYDLCLKYTYLKCKKYRIYTQKPKELPSDEKHFLRPLEQHICIWKPPAMPSKPTPRPQSLGVRSQPQNPPKAPRSSTDKVSGPLGVSAGFGWFRLILGGLGGPDFDSKICHPQNPTKVVPPTNTPEPPPEFSFQ